VMARGDRGEAIVRDDADRGTFVRTLAEACQRSGFRVHGFVLCVFQSAAGMVLWFGALP
jgi:putative transposase